jgi:hypothetical protein
LVNLFDSGLTVTLSHRFFDFVSLMCAFYFGDENPGPDKFPALKRIVQGHGIFRSAKALLSPNKFGGSHR